VNRRTALAAIGALIATGTHAQSQRAMPRIGTIEFGNPPDGSFVRSYLASLASLGFAEPRTLHIERRYAQGKVERYGALAQELATNRIDVAFTVGNDIAQAVRLAAPSIAVVTAGSEDPVMSGLIRDFRRPGGNVTGVTYLSPQLAGKRLELIREAVPGTRRVAVLWDPAHFDTYYKDMEPDARALAIQLELFEARSAEQIELGIAGARRARADALFIIPSRLMNLRARQIGEMALAARLPTISPYTNFTEAGALMSYGAVAADMMRRAAAQTAKILAGEPPGDLPFERASTFELVVNLKTARALGIAIPQPLLLRADRVIE
jgi:putative tryptophan/tyrosine transport system substrate-binding protein